MKGVRFKSALAAGPALWAAVMCVGGCEPSGAGKIQTDPVALDVRDVEPAVAYGDLAAVLEDAVRAGGRVEPVALKRQARALDAQLKRLAVTGPRVTPKLFATAEDRLAYWHNARAAWALALALRNDCPKKLPRAALEACRFPLDGREMTLDEIDDVLRADRDWRAVATAPSIREDRARLPTKPFSAANVRAEIARRFSEFLDDGGRFEIDQARRVLLFPPILWRMRKERIAAHHRAYGTTGASFITTLLPYVTGSAHRRLQDAIGLRIAQAKPTEAIVFPP